MEALADDEDGMLGAVYSSIGDDRSHPAMARFDVAAFIAELATKYPVIDANDPSDAALSDPRGEPPLYDVGDFTGEAANWVTFDIAYSQVAAASSNIVDVALRHGLLVYDPERGVVWGDKRSS